MAILNDGAPNLYDEHPSFDGLKLEVESSDRHRSEENDNIFAILWEEQPFTTNWIKPYLQQITAKNERPVFLDMGTGSGVYGIWVKKYFPQFKVIAVDRHDKAIAWAKRNAAQNGVEMEFLHETYDPKTMPERSCDVIGLYPPYHIYPKEIERFVPQHAAGGPDGQDAFKEQLKVVGDGKHLKENGVLFFNQFCPGDESGPDFLKYATDLVGGNPSLTWVNVLEPLSTKEYLNGTLDDRYPDFQVEFAEQYPMLYYAVGVIINDHQGTSRLVQGHNFDLKSRTWEDRILIHREFSAHAWK